LELLRHGPTRWPAIRVEDVNATAPRSTKWGSAQRLVARGHQFTDQLVLAREPQRLGWNQFIAEHHSRVFSDAWPWIAEKLSQPTQHVVALGACEANVKVSLREKWADPTSPAV
jgi:hypothetical protein